MPQTIGARLFIWFATLAVALVVGFAVFGAVANSVDSGGEGLGAVAGFAIAVVVVGAGGFGLAWQFARPRPRAAWWVGAGALVVVLTFTALGMLALPLLLLGWVGALIEACRPAPMATDVETARDDRER